MDKVLAVAVILAVLVIVISIQIYLGLEKNRTTAQFLLKEMDSCFNGWLAVAETLFSLELIHKDMREKYAGLSAAYRGIGRRQNHEKVAVLNQIHILATETVAGNIADRRITDFGYNLSAESSAFEDIRQEYNKAVSKLNALLDGRVAGFISKIARISPMVKLSNLDIL